MNETEYSNPETRAVAQWYLASPDYQASLEEFAFNIWNNSDYYAGDEERAAELLVETMRDFAEEEFPNPAALPSVNWMEIAYPYIEDAIAIEKKARVEKF